MPLIDTHQHLILRGPLSYAWTAGVPALAQGSFTPADYAALTGDKISASVFMETGVDDTDYRAEARLVAGLVGSGGMRGQVASIRPEEDAGFDDWLAECAGLHICGFRRILHVVPDDLSQSQTFRRNLRKIGAAGLPFDICMFARQLPLAQDLIAACPDQMFVLDHCGNPDVAGGGFDAWAPGIAAVAVLPNVVVKLSGITTNCAPGTVSVFTLKPFFNHLLHSFGPDRMLWGSDWPVVNLATGLPDWIAITHTLLADLTESERTAIASGTAQRVYRI